MQCYFQILVPQFPASAENAPVITAANAVVTGAFRISGIFADTKFCRDVPARSAQRIAQLSSQQAQQRHRDPLGRFSSHPPPTALEQMRRVRSQVERLRVGGFRV